MTQSIPKASAPDGKNFLYHLQAANDDLLPYLEHLATYGDIVQLSIFPAYLVNSPDLVQQVLISQAKSFDKPFNFTYVIQQKDNTLQVLSRYKVNTPTIAAENYTELKELFDLMINKHGEPIVLKKTN